MYKIVDGCFDWEVVDSQMYKIVDGSQYMVYLSLFQADRILEQLQTYIINYDLSNLREYWSYLNQRLFCRLETRFLSSVRKLEVGLLKFYLVNAQQPDEYLCNLFLDD
jgi:hypothetical protein